MENQKIRHASNDSKRSTKSRRSFKISRDVKDSRVSIIKEEEQVGDEHQTVDNREDITNAFFESFFSTLIAEKKSIIIEISQSFHSSTSLLPVSSDQSNSYLSMENGTIYGVNSSIYKDVSKYASLSTHSTIECTSTSTIPSCPSNCSCDWRVVFTNGNIYEGNLNGSLMEGKGSFYWNDGSIYQGEFKDGYPCGRGKLVLPDLSTYEGDFSMGFFHGNGNFSIKSSPILYNGDWKLSKKHGKGWLLYETGNSYEGDWVHNKKHGIGYRQFSNGDKYKGSWLDDKISGEGCMMWHNNDYYDGNWSKGYQEGYGEYTWNLEGEKCFAFSNYNCYKGNWTKGQRSGAGIMNFGHESGAKLAGTWLDNKKHGPGVMICGNGLILEKNPLFTDDKPSTYVKDDRDAKRSTAHGLDKKESGLKSFKSISMQILEKENLDALNQESIISIENGSANIKMNQYIKLLVTGTDNAYPLRIPIHHSIEDVDLEYFLEIFGLSFQSTKETTDNSTLEIEHIINTKTGPDGISCLNFLESNAELDENTLGTSASMQCIPNASELKNVIINYLPELRNIYKVYASMCVEEDLSFEPMLIRLFLWQIYRDIGVTDTGGLSIVEVDEILYKNPSSCLETLHNPWEPIYFWQFIQAMVGVACLLYRTQNRLDYTPTSGFMYHMFKTFLDHTLLVKCGNFQGNSLTYLKDLIPIDAVYRLYTEIGEPHTVGEFLQNTCMIKGQSLPCYKSIDTENDSDCTVTTGTNVVVLNNDVSFSETSQAKVHIENYNQKVLEGMYAFSCLGKKNILKSLTKICPQILSSTKRHQLSYRLSFIEFYEALLLLAFEKADYERNLLLEHLKTQSASESKNVSREVSKLSTHSATKRKKAKKYVV